MIKCNSFDIDGVIFMGEYDGIYPGKNDVIITGRSEEEIAETEMMLWSKNIKNDLYLNKIPFNMKTRESSGWHKGNTINMLRDNGIADIQCHFEDDPIQAEEIRKLCPQVNVIMVVHDLVEKENVRHEEY
jgi:hypothetical protein